MHGPGGVNNLQFCGGHKWMVQRGESPKVGGEPTEGKIGIGLNEHLVLSVVLLFHLDRVVLV